MKNSELLEKLIEEDYGFTTNGGRWGKSLEHDSLVLDREKGIFYYNSEGISGDVKTYLYKVRKWDYKTVSDYLKQFSGYTDTIIHEYNDGDLTIVYPKLVEIFHQNLMNVDKDYFYRRTITDESISRFQLGYENSFYTIPIFMNGSFKNFQLRKDNPKTIRMYYKGVGPLLFNSDITRITNKIFIVEAPTSAIVMNQNGLPSVSFTFGASSFQEEWFPIFISQKEIYLLLDNDSAGNRGAIKIAKILGLNKCKIYNFPHSDPNYDAGNFFEDGGTKEELLEEINTNGKYAYELKEWKK